VLNNKAMSLNKTGDTTQALEYLWRAYNLAPDHRDVATNLADALGKQDDKIAAIRDLRRLVENHSDHAVVIVTLASCLERVNQSEEAETLAAQALALDPTSFVAIVTLARCCRRADRFDRAMAYLDQACALPIADFQRSIALKERGQILDQQGDYASAFAMFTDANQIVGTLDTNSTETGSIFQRLSNAARWIKHHAPTSVASDGTGSSPQPDAATEPVFFMGFPRSGTTLVELMLKAHPRIASAGERAWVLMTMQQTGFVEPDQWDSMSDTDVVAAREIYWNHARRVHGDSIEQFRLLDKMPFNIVNLGFINRVFPRAKILMAIRDPRDCVLSAFMQNFAHTPELSPFRSLESGAGYCADVMGLWQGYQDNLNLDSLVFRYEYLVAHNRETLERILAHLGELWDDAVLSHHEQTSVVKTPSVRDVSKPVYQRATYRWKNYAEQMAPVQPVLKPFVDAFGYD
jgi:Flp pilus assembly protein TadD